MPECPSGFLCSDERICVEEGANGQLGAGLAESESEAESEAAVEESESESEAEAEAESEAEAEGEMDPVCGNGVCEASLGESSTSCSADCGTSPICGNSVCEAGETSVVCPADCGGAVCGNGACETPETAATCPDDCGTTGGGACTSNMDCITMGGSLMVCCEMTGLCCDPVADFGCLLCVFGGSAASPGSSPQ